MSRRTFVILLCIAISVGIFVIYQWYQGLEANMRLMD